MYVTEQIPQLIDRFHGNQEAIVSFLKDTFDVLFFLHLVMVLHFLAKTESVLQPIVVVPRVLETM